MRRLLGLFALVVGVSLLLTTTASAKDPEGRVVNSKTKRALKKLADPARDGTVPTEGVPTEATPAEATPAEATPADATPTETGQAQESTGETTEAAEPTVIRTYENIQVPEEEKRRAAAGRQTAAAEEQQVAGRIRGLQLLIEKEEQLLAQRMAYATKLREKGLAANDQKILDQAERFERAALAEYLKKVQQFERMSVTNSAPEQSRRAPMPPRTSKNQSPPRR
jgi:hypothetical protein